jgi:hypothetical protein
MAKIVNPPSLPDQSAQLKSDSYADIRPGKTNIRINIADIINFQGHCPVAGMKSTKGKGVTATSVIAS